MEIESKKRLLKYSSFQEYLIGVFVFYGDIWETTKRSTQNTLLEHHAHNTHTYIHNTKKLHVKINNASPTKDTYVYIKLYRSFNKSTLYLSIYLSISLLCMSIYLHFSLILSLSISIYTLFQPHTHTHTHIQTQTHNTGMNINCL